MDDTTLTGVQQMGPWKTLSIAKGRPQLGRIARYVSTSRDDIALTDNGQIVALVINPEVLEDLREENALLRRDLDKTNKEKLAKIGKRQEATA